MMPPTYGDLGHIGDRLCHTGHLTWGYVQRGVTADHVVEAEPPPKRNRPQTLWGSGAGVSGCRIYFQMISTAPGSNT